MSYDTTGLNSLPSDFDIQLPSQATDRGGILSMFRAASRAILTQAKRVGGKAIVSAVLTAAAVLCAPHRVEAQTVVATVTGTITWGIDVSGVFGPPNSKLAGKSVTLIFTLDSAVGQEGVAYCVNVPCESSLEANGVRSPGSVVVQIGSGSFTFGNLWNVAAQRSVSPAGKFLVTFSASDGLQNGATVDASPTSATPTWPTDYKWEDAFYFPGPFTGPASFGVYSSSPFQYALGDLTVDTITISGPGANGETLGGPSCQCTSAGNLGDFVSGDSAGSAFVGEPIDAATGNVYTSVTDYSTSGANPLSFTRSYNSMGNSIQSGGVSIATLAASMGTNWRTNYDRYLQIVSAASVNVERPDGQVLNFTLKGGVWTPNTDIDLKLKQSGSTWTLTDHNDNIETYTAVGTKATLTSIKARNGYTQTLTYSGDQLSSVTDSYDRTLRFGYSGGLLDRVTTPESTTISFDYTAVGSKNVLTSVTYPTSASPDITYHYKDTSFPFALTGILDGKGDEYASWTYDAQGRATSSQHGDGADLTKLTFNANGTVQVDNAFDLATTYTFSTLQGVPKVTEISRAATSTTEAATRKFGYDSTGYRNSETDWNGNTTTYVNNAQGNPTTINYAVGSPQAYSVTISYDPTFTHLPHEIVTPGLTSTFVYDGNGNPLSRTDLDTTTSTVPYHTAGQTRVTRYTWSSTGEELSVQLPRTDVAAKTSFGYDSTGALTSIKDALDHETKITSHTGGGLPLTVLDPNNVTTTLTYDGQQRPLTSTLHTGTGNLTTTWTYDPAGNLESVEQPDRSKLTFGYDTAHRLISMTDLLGNSTQYTLDALGDRTLVEVKNHAGTVTREHSGTFDALGRMLTDVGGMKQTTTYTWDNNGNKLTMAPPSPSGPITYTYDALNRLATAKDPSPGGTTTYSYDAHNRILSVRDANDNTTSYVYDGFGDRTQTASPDSGTTVYHFDLDRNLTQSVKPGSLTADYTWDALERNLTVKYPNDSTLNVERTYDQPTGHGFGIGRLTSAVDQVGSLSLTYNERGNVTQETRKPAGLSALVTSYGYDAAGNVSSITYPSTNLVQYARDSMGRVTSITAKPPGASSASDVATAIAYEPFGPVTHLTFGNALAQSQGYDLDYRPTTLTATGKSTIQNLTYSYFENDSVEKITDAVNKANTQMLGYDELDRLTSAVSGPEGYGSYSFEWDPVSNIKAQMINGVTTSYDYNHGTNQLSSIVKGSTVETVTTTPAGNASIFKIGSSTVETLAYNQANQLGSAGGPPNTARYAYDLFGRRIEEVGTVTGTSTFQYDRDNNLLTDTDGHGITRVDYIYLNGVPVGTYQPSNKKFYFISTDRLGTPTTATDSTQTVQWEATYQPFGYTSTGVGGIVQDLRLPGQEWDLESTLNHNGFRNYAPTLGRYVESDRIGLAGGMNTYGYVHQNPSKLIDRVGLNDETFLPPEYYGRNAPKLIPPGPQYYDWYKYDFYRGQWEYSRVFYNPYGQQIGRTDYTNHGYCEAHTDPHYHTTEWGSRYDPQYGYENGPFEGEYPGGPSPSVASPENTSPWTGSWKTWDPFGEGEGGGGSGGGGGGTNVLGPFDPTVITRPGGQQELE